MRQTSSHIPRKHIIDARARGDKTLIVKAALKIGDRVRRIGNKPVGTILRISGSYLTISFDHEGGPQTMILPVDMVEKVSAPAQQKSH